MTRMISGGGEGAGAGFGWGEETDAAVDGEKTAVGRGGGEVSWGDEKRGLIWRQGWLIGGGSFNPPPCPELPPNPPLALCVCLCGLAGV